MPPFEMLHIGSVLSNKCNYYPVGEPVDYLQFKLEFVMAGRNRFFDARAGKLDPRIGKLFPSIRFKIYTGAERIYTC